jgi:hypothetical protein
MMRGSKKRRGRRGVVHCVDDVGDEEQGGASCEEAGVSV